MLRRARDILVADVLIGLSDGWEGDDGQAGIREPCVPARTRARDRRRLKYPKADRARSETRAQRIENGTCNSVDPEPLRGHCGAVTMPGFMWSVGVLATWKRCAERRRASGDRRCR
jgi:hypothetical protein